MKPEKQPVEESEIKALLIESDGEVSGEQRATHQQQFATTSLDDLIAEVGEDLVTFKRSKKAGEWKIDLRVKEILDDQHSPLLPTLQQLVDDIKLKDNLEFQLYEFVSQLNDGDPLPLVVEFGLYLGGGLLALKAIEHHYTNDYNLLLPFCALVFFLASMGLARSRDISYFLSQHTNLPISVDESELELRKQITALRAEIPDIEQRIKGGFLELKLRWYLRENFFDEAQIHILESYKQSQLEKQK